jgi:hypothetical protein
MLSLPSPDRNTTIELRHLHPCDLPRHEERVAADDLVSIDVGFSPAVLALIASRPHWLAGSEEVVVFVRWKRRERFRIRAATKKWSQALRELCARHGVNLDAESPLPPATREPTGKFLLMAFLVRSERQGGKVRQRIVAYLGSVKEEYLGEWCMQDLFWSRAAARLDALALDRAERDRIEEALARVVRRPTPEETAKKAEDDAADVATIRELLRGL